MSGAAVLSGSAALRGGAGLVTVAVPEGIQATVAGGNPCYMTVALPQDEAGRIGPEALPLLLELSGRSDVVALGPGLGRSPELTNMVPELLKGVDKPLVVDADALFALVNQLECVQDRWAPLVFTPHPGEFARLVGVETAEVQQRREELAVEFASAQAIVLVLKGQGTIVTDGQRCYVNTTGNPGMATGGTGDILTGLVAALLAQGLDGFAAAQLGTHLHGRAGDLAAEVLGEPALIATDLLHSFGAAFRSASGGRQPSEKNEE
jgi:ADP-dependent NAD(P)H-hydrate dehydratase